MATKTASRKSGGVAGRAVPRKAQRKVVARDSAKTARISARIDPESKAEAVAIFKKVGLEEGEALRLFYRMAILHRGLPFEVKIPNEETQAAIDELERGDGTVYNSVDELFDFD